MASVVYFKKLSEQPGCVRYCFGEGPSEMSRTLTIATGSRTSTPDDGDADYTFLKASRKISSLFDERKGWPERGMGVS
ncbi:hypothetical protein [Streptomyces beihaiensis]|uniref:Uncharacterized protein n=1 Tax=Streptomyces beihaiensis TaxID=2984495 RepID=A0ABT3U4Y7_9ACTN|nr:hypothetical protein [Streptomyces beihaiensis]MCX3063642.1 hypothetical protein [Streptomyces beihaiensis]